MSTKSISLLLAAFLFACLPVHAQDHDPVDAILSNLYASITFNKKHAPDFETFKSLYIDGARLISVKDTTTYELTIPDYIKSMTNLRKSGKISSFEEHEIHRETEIYGNIMHVFSTYKTAVETADGPETARGINSIQMLKQNGEWKIVSLIWYEENEAHLLRKNTCRKHIRATINIPKLHPNWERALAQNGYVRREIHLLR